MPGSTPVLGIPYPLLNETVDPTIFQQFATTVNNAIATNQTSAQYELTGKPTFRGFGPSSSNPAVGPGVTTTITLGTPTVDNNVFFSAGAPTRVTINTSGVYHIAYFLNTFGYTTHTKTIIDILYNGVQGLASCTNHGSVGQTDLNLPYMWPLSAGDFLQFRWQWTGTGTNQIFQSNISLMYLCPLV